MSCEFANLGGDEVAAALEVLQKQGFTQLCQAAHPPSVIPRVFHQLEGLVRRAIQARQVVQAVDWVRNEGLEFEPTYKRLESLLLAGAFEEEQSVVLV